MSVADFSAEYIPILLVKNEFPITSIELKKFSSQYTPYQLSLISLLLISTDEL